MMTGSTRRRHLGRYDFSILVNFYGVEWIDSTNLGVSCDVVPNVGANISRYTMSATTIDILNESSICAHVSCVIYDSLDDYAVSDELCLNLLYCTSWAR